MGPGKAELIERIAQTGSHLGRSSRDGHVVRRAWQLVERAEPRLPRTGRHHRDRRHARRRRARHALRQAAASRQFRAMEGKARRPSAGRPEALRASAAVALALCSVIYSEAWTRTDLALLAAGMLVAAFGYASVGHGGASAYIAAMALAGIAPAGDAADRAAAQYPGLVARHLEVPARRVSSAGACSGRSPWSRFRSLTSAARSRCRGTPTRSLVGVVLLYAAWQLWRSGAQRRGDARSARAAARAGRWRSARRWACSPDSPASAAAFS